MEKTDVNLKKTVGNHRPIRTETRQVWLSLKSGGTFQKCEYRMRTTLKREAQNEKGQFWSSTTPMRNAKFWEANFGMCTTIKRNTTNKEAGL